MGLIDHLTPTFYKVLRMEVKREAEVVAAYSVAILNAEGEHLDRLNLTVSLTTPEKVALAGIFTRDKAAFETDTGLAEWSEP